MSRFIDLDIDLEVDATVQALSRYRHHRSVNRGRRARDAVDVCLYLAVWYRWENNLSEKWCSILFYAYVNKDLCY